MVPHFYCASLSAPHFTLHVPTESSVLCLLIVIVLVKSF